MNELYPGQEPMIPNSTTQTPPITEQILHNPQPGQPPLLQNQQQQQPQQPRGIEQAKQNLQLIIGGFNSMMGLVAGIMNAYLLCSTILKSVLKGVFSVLRKILPIRLAKVFYRFLSRSIVGSLLRTLKQSLFPAIQSTPSQQDVFNHLWEQKPTGISLQKLTLSAVKALLKGALLLSLPLIGRMELIDQGAAMLHRFRNRKSAMLRDMRNAVRQRRVEESSRDSSLVEGYYDEGWLGASLGPKSQETLKDYKLTRVAEVMEEPEELLLAQELEDPSLRYFAPARVSMVTIKESKFFNSGRERKEEDESKEMDYVGPPNSEEQKNGERTMFEEWLKSSHSYSGK